LSADDTAQAKPRRDEAKRAAAKAFAAACDESGLEIKDVAGDLGISAKGTRLLRLRSADTTNLDVVPTTADLILARADLFDAWLARIVAARKTLHGASATRTVEGLLARALVADADVQRVAAGVLEDGVCEPAEVPAIEDVLDRSDQTRGELRKALARRGMR
jgi:hypothetical protein